LKSLSCYIYKDNILLLITHWSIQKVAINFAAKVIRCDFDFRQLEFAGISEFICQQLLSLRADIAETVCYVDSLAAPQERFALSREMLQLSQLELVGISFFGYVVESRCSDSAQFFCQLANGLIDLFMCIVGSSTNRHLHVFNSTAEAFAGVADGEHLLANLFLGIRQLSLFLFDCLTVIGADVSNG
jgi:hypothetical protein